MKLLRSCAIAPGTASGRLLYDRQACARLLRACLFGVVTARALVPCHADPGTARAQAASLRATLSASTKEGFSAAARIEAGAAALRLEGTLVPAQGDESTAIARGSLALAFPYARAGYVRPQGLLAFLYQPASSDTYLSEARGSPLRIAGLADASLLGLALGEAAGFLAALPARPGKEALTGREAIGAWYGPQGGPLSLVFALSGEPAAPGGPSWYDTPRPPRTRWHGAAALHLGRSGFWGLGAAAAVFAATPGSPDAESWFPFLDGGAARVEARLALGRWRLESQASASSDAWSGLSGRGSDTFRFDTELRFLGKRLGWNGAYRYALGSWALLREACYSPGQAADDSGGGSEENGEDLGVDTEAGEREARSLGTHTVRSGLSLHGGLGAAKAGSSVVLGSGTSAITVDASLRPAALPWLGLSSSWRAVDGRARRFDLGAAIDLGTRPRFGAELGLRFLPEGRQAKASLSCRLPGTALSLGCELATDGWLSTDMITKPSAEASIPVSISAWVRLTP